jgi:hypothetical protein
MLLFFTVLYLLSATFCNLWRAWSLVVFSRENLLIGGVNQKRVIRFNRTVGFFRTILENLLLCHLLGSYFERFLRWLTNTPVLIEESLRTACCEIAVDILVDLRCRNKLNDILTVISVGENGKPHLDVIKTAKYDSRKHVIHRRWNNTVRLNDIQHLVYPTGQTAVPDLREFVIAPDGNLRVASENWKYRFLPTWKPFEHESKWLRSSSGSTIIVFQDSVYLDAKRDSQAILCFTLINRAIETVVYQNLGITVNLKGTHAYFPEYVGSTKKQLIAALIRCLNQRTNGAVKMLTNLHCSSKRKFANVVNIMVEQLLQLSLCPNMDVDRFCTAEVIAQEQLPYIKKMEKHLENIHRNIFTLVLQEIPGKLHELEKLKELRDYYRKEVLPLVVNYSFKQKKVSEPQIELLLGPTMTGYWREDPGPLQDAVRKKARKTMTEKKKTLKKKPQYMINYMHEYLLNFQPVCLKAMKAHTLVKIEFRKKYFKSDYHTANYVYRASKLDSELKAYYNERAEKNKKIQEEREAERAAIIRENVEKLRTRKLTQFPNKLDKATQRQLKAYLKQIRYRKHCIYLASLERKISAHKLEDCASRMIRINQKIVKKIKNPVVRYISTQLARSGEENELNKLFTLLVYIKNLRNEPRFRFDHIKSSLSSVITRQDKSTPCSVFHRLIFLL